MKNSSSEKSRHLESRDHWAMFRSHHCIYCSEGIYPGMPYTRSVARHGRTIVVRKWHRGGCPEKERMRIEEQINKEQTENLPFAA